MMTNNNCSHGGSKFMSGFLWGIIIGGGLVFLLGTKKGKKIIKTLSEEGLELSDLLGGDEEEELEEVIIHPSKKAHKSIPEKEKTEESEENIDHQLSETENGISKPSTFSQITQVPRRFFRGVPKR